VRRTAGALLSILALLAFSANPVLAAGVIDQQQTDVGGWNGGSPIWNSDYAEMQIFTAGVSRNLIAVQVYAGYYGPTSISGTAATGTVMMEVLPVNNGTPDFIFVWAREFKRLPFDPTWITFNLSTPVALTAGTQYAIMLQASAPWGIDWLGSCLSGYAGGRALVMNMYDPFSLKPVDGWGSAAYYCTKDLGFRTIVEAAATPTPVVTHTATPVATHTATPAAAPTRTPAPGAATPTAAATATGIGVLPPPPPPPPSLAPSRVSTASAPGIAVAGATSVPVPADPGSGSGGSSSSSLPLILAALAAAGVVLGGFAFWRLRLHG
jgi:hypothetical protein